MSKSKISLHRGIITIPMKHTLTHDEVGIKQIEICEKNGEYRLSVVEDLFHNPIINVTVFDLSLDQVKQIRDNIDEYINLIDDRGNSV